MNYTCKLIPVASLVCSLREASVKFWLSVLNVRRLAALDADLQKRNKNCDWKWSLYLVSSKRLSFNVPNHSRSVVPNLWVGNEVCASAAEINTLPAPVLLPTAIIPFLPLTWPKFHLNCSGMACWEPLAICVGSTKVHDRHVPFTVL